MPTIEGASPEQERLLDAILDGLRSTRIASVALYPYRPRFEDMHEPPPVDYGDVVTIEIDVDDRRALWEATLLANAFACRSNASGLRKVLWFDLSARPGVLHADARSRLSGHAGAAACPVFG